MKRAAAAEALVPLQAWREPSPPAAAAVEVSTLRLAAEGAAALAAAVVALAVLAACALRDTLRFPFSDAHDWAAEAMRAQREGGWVAYLWRPHGEQRIPWARLAEALSLFAPGRPPAFLLIGALLWGSGAAGLAVLLWRSPAAARTRLWLAAGAVLLVTCAPLAEDFAFPVFSVYLYAAGPALAAGCLWAAAERGLRSPAFWAALVCASLASGGNAAGLAVWPALIGAALVVGETGATLWVLLAVGLACLVGVEAGLGAPGGAPTAASSGVARLIKTATYFGGYCGLPWSRALRWPPLGAALGGAVALAAAPGLAGAWRHRLRGDATASLRRAGAALALFGLATAILAALGRVDELPQPIVPTRYTPFALVLQLGVLLLHAERLQGWIERRQALASSLAAVLMALVVAADLRGARLLDKTADHLRAASRAFDAGRLVDIPMHPRPAFAHAVRRALIARGLAG